MKRPSCGPRQRSEGSERESGSLLTEAVVGVTLLALITAGAAASIPAALEADARASAHRAALGTAESVLEAMRAGIDVGSVLVAGHGDSIESQVHAAFIVDGPPAGPCEAPTPWGTARAEVRVQHGGRTDGRELVLATGVRDPEPQASVPDGGPTGSIVLVPPMADPASLDLVLLGPGGADLAPIVVRPSCVAFPPVGPGTAWVSGAPDAPPLIDRVQVGLHDRPVALTTGALTSGRGPSEMALDVAPAGSLRVVVETHGARMPDHVASGALRWFVRGDDARVATGLGQARLVRSGPTTAVVSACGTGEAMASTIRADVPPGEEMTVAVPLAVVTVEGVAGRHDAWLHVQRSRPCADGSGLYASMRFEGGLHDGIRLAMPRGEWDAWLRTPTGSPLTGSVRFAASATDAVVLIP